MIDAKSLLNKIKWDKNIDPRRFTIGYFDRIQKRVIWIDYSNIKRIEGTFMIVERQGEESHIPLHRIREAREDGRTVWKRN